MLDRRSLCLVAALLTACGAPEPGPQWEPPQALVFTPDLISRFETWNAEVGGSGSWDSNGDIRITRPGFVVLVSSLDLPPLGDDLVGRHPDEAQQSAMLDALAAGLELYRIDDGARVDATAVRGCFDVFGESLCGTSDGHVVSLVPSAPLADGWYLFRADFSSLGEHGIEVTFPGARHDGQVAYARVRWGSLPTFSTLDVRRDRDGARWSFNALVTEPVPESLWSSSSVEVRYDGVAVTCEVAGGEAGFAAGCPAPSSDAVIEVALRGSAVPDVEGMLERTLSMSGRVIEESGDGCVRMDVVADFGRDLVIGATP